jgi:hypothetical protein
LYVFILEDLFAQFRLDRDPGYAVEKEGRLVTWVRQQQIDTVPAEGSHQLPPFGFPNESALDYACKAGGQLCDTGYHNINWLSTIKL